MVAMRFRSRLPSLFLKTYRLGFLYSPDASSIVLSIQGALEELVQEAGCRLAPFAAQRAVGENLVARLPRNPHKVKNFAIIWDTTDAEVLATALEEFLRVFPEFRRARWIALVFDKSVPVTIGCSDPPVELPVGGDAPANQAKSIFERLHVEEEY